MMATSSNIYEVQTILGKRVRQGSKEFLIRWKGFTAADDSWEPEGNLIGCQVLVKDFLQRTRTPSPRRKHWRKSQANLQTPPTVEGFTQLRSRKSVGEDNSKVLRYKCEPPPSPSVKKGSHTVKTAIHEQKEENTKEHETPKEVPLKEEKPLGRKSRYWHFLGWLIAIILFVLMLLLLASLLPVVN